VGASSLFKNQTGNDNVAIGNSSLYMNTNGSNNVAIGSYALYYNLADDNTAVGLQALNDNYQGTGNVAVGGYSLSYNSSGGNNTAVGYTALKKSGGSNNTAVGSNALNGGVSSSTDFYSCNAFGYYALYKNLAGNNNAFGTGALQNNTDGTFNCAMGEDAMLTNVTGSYNTAIGCYSDVSTANLTNATSLGYGAVADASNQVRLGDASISSLYCTGAFYGSVQNITRQLYADLNGKIGYLVSSARYKTNILDMENVDWLFRLRPVNYTYKTDEKNTKQYGLIAEEVEKVIPDMVSFDKEGKPETVNYSTLITPLLKAVQEQQQNIVNLKHANDALSQKVELLLKRVEELERRP
jgi:hypothetical protein